MRQFLARVNDAAMCLMMDWRQRRHTLPADFRQAWVRYADEHAAKSRDAYYMAPQHDAPATPEAPALSWSSPHPSAHPENQRCQALLFPSAKGWGAPTVLMLHALMSASDRGYRRWARTFNERGWNAVFVHLPYHYSRTPRKHWTGELAITADAVRTAEGLRAGVAECRQLMDWLRRHGCPEFGLWACSYGGWIGSLLASVERDFRFAALIEPIVSVDNAIWESPAGLAVRRGLTRAGLTRDDLARLYPLLAPDHGEPAFSAQKVVFAAGRYDRIAPLHTITAVAEKWRGSTLLVEPQGHFGYRLMRAAWRHLQPVL